MADTALHRQMREQQIKEWTMCAPGWVRHRDNFTRPSVSITHRMAELVKLSPGMRVLDVACGIGNPAFAIAEMVGPRGEVVGVDLVPAMIDGARAWAREHSVDNVEFRVIPAETELGVPDGTFDAATCRAGLQYMADPVGALTAMHAALREGGRAVAMTLGPPDRSLAYRVYAEVLAAHTDQPPDPSAPGPVALSSPEVLRSMFAEAGFADVSVESHDSTTVEAEDPAAFWDLFERTAGPFMAVCQSVSEQQRRAMREAAIARLTELKPVTPLGLDSEMLLATGMKAAR
jgi:ubiquinone/menaquinone biosynthesis C-methylase UbiE